MKNKFKLLLVLVMTLCAIFSFTACLESSDGSEESDSSQVTESSSDSSSDSSSESNVGGVTPSTKYTVKFVNYDDSVISSAEYEEGATVVTPTETPVKPADNTYTYTFNGWDAEVVAVSGNAIYKATYTETYIDYTVTFLNYDDSEISTATYHYGDTVIVPTATRESDKTYEYVFAGWDAEVDATVIGNATYKATYTEKYVEYTVKFVNDDGSEISTKTYHYEDTVVGLTETPTKKESRVYTFEFAGWDKEVVAVSESVTYTATYTATLKEGYKVNDTVASKGESIVLNKGQIGGGANYTLGQQNDDGDETPSFVKQAYFAFDGNYSLNDYVVFDFTGKNMPEVAFFANNYNDSMYAEETSKQGIVVVTGVTTWDGQLESGVNENGTQINYGFPYMIQDAAAGNFVSGAFANSALGRANLVDNTHYRVIMGFTGSENAITLHWYLYNLDTKEKVEESSMTTWNFFTGDNAQVGNMTINDLIGSIVLYGKFGVETTLDKVWGVYEDTTIANIFENLEKTYTVNFVGPNGEDLSTDTVVFGGSATFTGTMPTLTVTEDEYFTYEYAWDKSFGCITEDTTVYLELVSKIKEGAPTYNTTSNGKNIVLGASGIGGGANYNLGQNNDDGDATPSYVDQSYFAIDGNYGLNSYVAFDFTGKNLPEIAFFAKNYNNSMYADGTTKQGIVVVTGITDWQGNLGSGVNNNGTQINYGFPYMIQDASNGGFCQGAFANSKLGRANLVDNTQYRVIMGFTGSENAITLHWYLYNLDTNAVEEEGSMTTWNFFTGSNAQVGNMTINDLSGSIVLYGKFGVTCTIDKLHGVYEDTSIADIVSGLSGEKTYTVTFKGINGETLETVENLAFDSTVSYSGTIPTYEGSGSMLYDYSYGWDKEIVKVTKDATYTLVLKQTVKSGYSANNVTENGNIVLGAGGIGDGANYALGQNNGGYVNQSYLGLDGNYGLNSYVVFDFTGKNMPEIAFFANNYNNSMYAEGTKKQGVVVVTGITTWEGKLESGVNGNGTQINYGFPYMIQDASNGEFCQGAFANSALGRANLVDGTHYRVIMGFTGSDSAITLNWCLYNLDTKEVVEQSSMTTWNFFTGSESKVGNMTIDDLSGSIVLYGKFGATCTIDKLYGVKSGSFSDIVAEYTA